MEKRIIIFLVGMSNSKKELSICEYGNWFDSVRFLKLVEGVKWWKDVDMDELEECMENGGSWLLRGCGDLLNYFNDGLYWEKEDYDEVRYNVIRYKNEDVDWNEKDEEKIIDVLFDGDRVEYEDYVNEVKKYLEEEEKKKEEEEKEVEKYLKEEENNWRNFMNRSYNNYKEDDEVNNLMDYDISIEEVIEELWEVSGDNLEWNVEDELKEYEDWDFKNGKKYVVVGCVGSRGYYEGIEEIREGDVLLEKDLRFGSDYWMWRKDRLKELKEDYKDGYYKKDEYVRLLKMYREGSNREVFENDLVGCINDGDYWGSENSDEESWYYYVVNRLRKEDKV